MENSANIKRQRHEAESVWSQAYSTLPSIINAKKFKVGAEIGVAYGGHVEAILKKTRVVSLFGVDPYIHFENWDDPINLPQENFDQLYKFVIKRLSTYSTRYIHLRMTSENAVKHIPKLLDFVYIDANHTYEGIKKDLNLWYGKVKDGGIICGHDYNHPNFPGIKLAVDEFFSRFDWKINVEANTVWWVEKKQLPVSFIVPAFNCASTLEETVDSIFDHNFNSIDEVVIVNDASTDGTHNLCLKLKNKYKKIKYIIHKINRGGGATRNTAVMNSQNQLLFCLDSDNILSPGSLKFLKDEFIKNIVDIVCFGKIKFFTGNINKLSHEWIFIKRNYTFSDSLNYVKVPGSSGNYLFTRKSWIEAGGYPEFAGALDAWGFGIRQLAAKAKMITVPNTFYYHRLSQNSYWIRDSMKKNTSIKALQIILPFIDQLEDKDVDWLLSSKGRIGWFENIGKKKLRLKTNNITINGFKDLIKKII